MNCIHNTHILGLLKKEARHKQNIRINTGVTIDSINIPLYLIEIGLSKRKLICHCEISGQTCFIFQMLLTRKWLISTKFCTNYHMQSSHYGGHFPGLVSKQLGSAIPTFCVVGQLKILDFD